MNKQNKFINLEAGGFRVAWFIPLETVTFGITLTLGLKYGFGIASAVVLIPFMVLLTKIVKYQAKPRIAIKTPSVAVVASPEVDKPKKLSFAHRSKLQPAN